MNYVTCYWLPPDASQQRKDSLRAYFDLQRYTKEQFGATQIIVTNLEYNGATPWTYQGEMTKEYGLFSRYYALRELIRDGLEFPVALHDHDTFIKAPLKPSDSAILCGSKTESNFSEQLVVYPEISRTALMNCIARFERHDFHKGTSSGYGTEVRHEQMYSAEIAMGNMEPPPFDGIPIEASIVLKDLVSFDILEHHSLDSAYCESESIPDYVQAVHGHLNKGPATDALIDWLSK